MSEARVASPLGDGSAAITPLGAVGRVIIRCGEGEVGVVSERIGVALPREACRSVQGQGLNALWLGPDEWLILGASLPEMSLRLDGVLCSLVDVSHRQVALAVHGPRAEDILASGCALDLSAAAFPVGMCTRTMFAKAEIVLWRTGAETFHIEVWRSFARYVEALLHQAEGEV